VTRGFENDIIFECQKVFSINLISKKLTSILNELDDIKFQSNKISDFFENDV